MKRVGNLYKEICSMDNLRKAHKNARKGKGWYEEVKAVDADQETYLKALQDMLINHTYHTSEYRSFIKKENGKEREIFKLPYFPDRICQWAILQVIEPYLLKHLTKNTYSAIPDKGIHAALHDVQKAMQTDVPGCQYCLKLDVRKFYPSINHDILKAKFRRLFKDPELLWLLDEIIDSISTAKIENMRDIWLLDEDYDSETGIPIGNYLSQYCGNFYLSFFDHWIKEEMRVKYEFRYMDDILIFGRTKEELHQLRRQIDVYFRTELKLMIKPNWQVFPSYVRGVDFVGYRIFLNYVLLRKSSCINFKNRMVEIAAKVENGQLMSYSDWCSINSYKGWLKHCDSARLQEKYVLPIQAAADRYYIEVIYKKKGGKKMVDYGKVRSTVKPEPLVVDEYSVWKHTDIQKVDEPGTDEMPGFSGYEYGMIQYEKDEFILAQEEKNAKLEKQVDDTQLALCDVYEMMI